MASKKTISVRDKLCKEMIKAKNDQLKKRKHETYETYRNKVVELLRVSRKWHYQKYFGENKKNSWAIWQSIHDIVYSKKRKKNNARSSFLIDEKTIANSKDMAENFNFLSLLGKSFKATPLLPESTKLII